jgi:hypothetical protein
MSGGNGGGGVEHANPFYCDRGERFDRIDAREDRIEESIGGIAAELAMNRTATEMLEKRIGVIHDDGTVTPHSMTAAMVANTNAVLELKRTLELDRAAQSSSAPPPPTWGDDVGEITRIQPTPVLARRAKDAERDLRKALRSRNVLVILTPIILSLLGIVELYLRTRHP